MLTWWSVIAARALAVLTAKFYGKKVVMLLNSVGPFRTFVGLARVPSTRQCIALSASFRKRQLHALNYILCYSSAATSSLSNLINRGHPNITWQTSPMKNPCHARQFAQHLRTQTISNHPTPLTIRVESSEAAPIPNR